MVRLCIEAHIAGYSPNPPSSPGRFLALEPFHQVSLGTFDGTDLTPAVGGFTRRTVAMGLLTIWRRAPDTWNLDPCSSPAVVVLLTCM